MQILAEMSQLCPVFESERRFFRMLKNELYLVLFLAPLVYGDNCDEHGVLLYNDLGCQPIKDKPDDACPSSFDCRHFHELGSHCLFKGKKYEQGQFIPSNITTLSCNVGCLCTQESSFTCAILDCPEWLGAPLTSPECLRSYTLNQCCSSGELCPPFDDVAKCESDGQIYKEGQKFYPKDSCSVCVCQKGYSGKYEAPHCRPISCAAELKHTSDLANHCAPVYDDKEVLCCPSLWACASETDIINPAENPSNRNDTCIYGNKNVKLGETLDTKIEKYGKNHIVKCECKLPPLLTCIVKDSEYLKG